MRAASHLIRGQAPSRPHVTQISHTHSISPVLVAGCINDLIPAVGDTAVCHGLAVVRHVALLLHVDGADLVRRAADGAGNLLDPHLSKHEALGHRVQQRGRWFRGGGGEKSKLRRNASIDCLAAFITPCALRAAPNWPAPFTRPHTWGPPKPLNAVLEA